MDQIEEKLQLLYDLGKYREVVRFAQEELGREPQWGRGYTNLARAYSKLGDLDRAREAARQGIKHAPNDAWGHGILSMLLAESGDYDAALAANSEALRLSPDWDGNNAGRAWIQNMSGRYDEALATADDGLRLDPESCQLLIQRSWTLFKTGRLVEAMDCSAAGRAKHPLEPSFANTIGCLRTEFGRTSGRAAAVGHFLAADADLVEAIRLAPNAAAYHRDRRLNALAAAKPTSDLWAGAGSATFLAMVFGMAAWTGGVTSRFVAGFWVAGCTLFGLIGWGIDHEAAQLTVPRLRTPLPRVPLDRGERLLGHAIWAAFVTLMAGVAIATLVKLVS